MKIIHIITTIELGGAEKQLLTLVKSQVMTGNEVEVIYLKGNPDLLQDFSVIGANVNKILIGVSSLKQIIYLRKYLSKGNLIIHAHLPQAEIYAAICKSTNKLIISRHVAARFIPRSNLLISCLASLFCSFRADEVIAISNAVKKYLQDSYEIFPTRRIHVVLYAFNWHSRKELDRKNENRKEFGIPDTVFVLGTVARIVEQKDFPTLLKAFKEIQRQNRDSFLVIAGVGKMGSKMKILAEDLGISDHVLWLGRVRNIENLLKAIDIFILTTKYEGFGLVLLESMNADIPIVASNNSSVPEVLGIDYPHLIKTGDVAGFVSAVNLLMEDDARATAITHLSGRKHLFTPERLEFEISRIYIGLDT